MSVSTIRRGWAVAQVAALVLVVSGVAFPATVSADQSNPQDGQGQNFGDNGHDGDHHDWHDRDGSNNGGDDGDNNGDDQGGDQSTSTPATPPPPTTATVVATKIVCDNASDLPAWGDGTGPDITATTATDFVAAHTACHLTPDWNFQWAPDASPNPGDNTGSAGSPWTTFGPTAADGTVSTEVPATDASAATWFREVWQDGYVPFTFNTNNQTNIDTPSAGMYCNTDHTNYDNYDEIDGAQAGDTYYCVAFNALATTTTTTDGGGNASTTDSGGGTASTTSDTSDGSSSSNSSNGSNGGSGGGGGGVVGAGGCASGFEWNQSALKCVPQGNIHGQVLGASCGIYMNKYIKLGSAKNDPSQVTKLQTFLNTWMGTNLPITGVYDQTTFTAVTAFQNKYKNQVLKPWGANTPATGLVYLSTLWQINYLECPDLTLAYPHLVPWNQNPNPQ